MLTPTLCSRQPLPSPPTATPTGATALPASFSSPSHLQQHHALLLKSGKSTSLLPLSTVALLCAFSPPPIFSYSRRVLQRASDKPEIFVWNTCLNALADSDTPLDAIRLLCRLFEAGLVPDSYTFSFAIKGCSEALAVPIGKMLHGLVEKSGFSRSDVYLQNTILHMYASGGAMENAWLLFEKMPRRDVVTWNILVTQHSKRGEMGSAKELFGRMPERSVRAWTAMIAGHVQCGNPKEALRVFEEMERAGARPSEVTVVAVVAACADLGALDLGRRVHEYSDRCGFHKNVKICNTLIDMYIKCGCLDIARRVFDEMEGRTVVSWSAMIAGLAMHGQGEQALALFAEMTRAGVRPNAVTFVGLLHACSHMGLLEEGRRFFASMTKNYGIVPEIEHYGSMVDLLSRAGLLQEALEFIRSMPIAPNGVVWGALLGGAKVHKSVEMGEEAIKHLRVLDPQNDGYYVVLSNIYAEAGRWEDVARVRRLMRDEGVKKTPGWSTISVDGIVHEFVAGDSDHPQVEKINDKWEELLVQMKLRGYIPDTSAVLLDMEEGQKEHVLYRHSEKLAVTFGLLTTPAGTPIRILKNLRVCSDCHAALKLISDIACRQIVVRDRNRFHCFKDGSCSCRDYW